MKIRTCVTWSLLRAIYTATLTITLCGSMLSQPIPGHSQVQVRLRPPFANSYPITSWFDHRYPDYSKDFGITIYDGELTGDCNPPVSWGYCYDGHSGIDFALSLGTPVLAAESGVVELVASSAGGYGNHVVIRHQDSSRTLYGHLRESTVSPAQTVNAGSIVGYSGNSGNSSGPHLHFGVYAGPFSTSEENAVDPFGWRGIGDDPLIGFHGHRSACLWRSADEDQVSCVDTTVEDGHSGFGSSAGWAFDTRGNSFEFHYRSNSYEVYPNAFALWANDQTHGSCGVYVWVPANNATSHNVEYRIWAYVGQDWNREISADRLDQGAHSNEWVYLRSVSLNANEYPAVTIADMWTGEPIGTQWIAADAVKFRCYKTYILPVASPP